MKDNEQRAALDRRRFLAAGAGSLAALSLARGARADEPEPLPTRALGKTGVKIPILGLGTAAVGQSRPVTMDQAREVIREAVRQGIWYMDSARGYDKAEDALGLALGPLRDQCFITTKARTNNPQRQFDDSLRRLKTDHVDLLYWHESSGQDTGPAAFAETGMMTWLSKQKQAGKARFIGVTGHMKPQKMLPLLESGLVEVLMVPLNFVDRQQYHFEDIVLPVARAKGIGVLAMKVFGGEKGSNWGRYAGANPGPQLDEAQLELALRYALSLEGVSGAVVGMHTVEQVRQNAARARAFRPLTAAEQATAEELGKQWVAGWGPRFGPVA